MNIYDKISRMPGNETYEQKMYMLLNTEHYRQGQYETKNYGEEMAMIHQLILGWWKPRFLLDHRTQCAYEFMYSNFELVTVTDEDILWYTLKGIPQNIIERAENHDAYFPTHVFGFQDGKATVQWQINPDGRYYEDDDGFGGTSDVEISLWGKIDRTGKVIEPFHFRDKDKYLLSWF
jgi:hypothetical protein